ncbi:EAL domain-containing response regulator [Pseudomonas pergaminensis]
MTHLRVLVLENQRFQRSVLIKMLDNLGVRDVVQASDSEHALVQMQESGGVDIVLCDLADRSFDCLDFLRCAAQSGMVCAVALCSDLGPELRRSLGQMGSLSGLQLLGVIKPPVQIRTLSKILHRYAHRCIPPVFSPDDHPLPSEDEIRRGLALGEFRAWFQPKFALDTGELAGVEALARWEHPTKGVLLPADFLAAVLAYDLIDQMFKQLLEQGLSLLGILRRQEVQIELSFNLHASQLVSDELIGHIQSALGLHGFPGSTLTFELAENGLLDIPSRIQDNLLRLRLLGCGLSVDDFGMGFSSLRSLCQLPFNQLKLDGEIIRNVNEPRSQALIASTLALAQSLDMSLVIEGISSARIRDAITEMGCKLGQGFYLARPMAGYRLLPWITAQIASQQAPIN